MRTLIVSYLNVLANKANKPSQRYVYSLVLNNSLSNTSEDHRCTSCLVLIEQKSLEVGDVY
jgi:hypothetical protein